MHNLFAEFFVVVFSIFYTFFTETYSMHQLWIMDRGYAMKTDVFVLCTSNTRRV